MLLIGVSFACYSPSLNSLQDQAYRSAVVIEGKVQSAPQNVSAEPYSVNVKVLDVWPRNSGGLERDQLVTVGEFGSEAPCAKVKKNHKYIFFMDPTDEPLVFKASFAPLDTSVKNLKKDVGRILCEDCGKFMPTKCLCKGLQINTLAIGFGCMLMCGADDIQMFGVSNRWGLVGASLQQYWAGIKRLKVFRGIVRHMQRHVLRHTRAPCLFVGYQILSSRQL